MSVNARICFNKLKKYAFILPFFTIIFILCFVVFSTGNISFEKPIFLFAVALFMFDFLIKKFLLYTRNIMHKYYIRVYTWDSRNGEWWIFIICMVFGWQLCSKLSPDDIKSALLKSLLCSLVLAYLKQRDGYRQFEINDCQNWEKSIGAYWAHHAYDSFYKIVLQSMLERMTEFETEYNVKLLVKKLVIVIPKSCNVTNSLIENDEKLEFINYLRIIECDQGGNINRKYKNPVYKISSTKDLYIAFEFPNSVQTLWHSKYIMERERLNYHLTCFTLTLESLVKDDPCIILKYDDTMDSPPPLHSFLISHLTKKDSTIVCLEL